MSGEVSRARQKKAGSAAKKGQNSNNVQAAHLKYAAKKKSKERQKMNQKNPARRSCCSAWTLMVMLAMTGLSVGTYHQYPDQFKAAYDQLPVQVN